MARVGSSCRLSLSIKAVALASLFPIAQSFLLPSSSLQANRAVRLRAFRPDLVGVEDDDERDYVRGSEYNIDFEKDVERPYVTKYDSFLVDRSKADAVGEVCAKLDWFKQVAQEYIFRYQNLEQEEIYKMVIQIVYENKDYLADLVYGEELRQIFKDKGREVLSIKKNILKRKESFWLRQFEAVKESSDSLFFNLCVALINSKKVGDKPWLRVLAKEFYASLSFEQQFSFCVTQRRLEQINQESLEAWSAKTNSSITLEDIDLISLKCDGWLVKLTVLEYELYMGFVQSKQDS